MNLLKVKAKYIISMLDSQISKGNEILYLNKNDYNFLYEYIGAIFLYNNEDIKYKNHLVFTYENI